MTSLAFVLAFLISAFTLLPIGSDTPPTASLTVGNIQVVRGRPHYYSPKREEYALIRFDLDADLSPLFGWNTKQVFVYVSAEYPAEHGQGLGHEGTNKAVIWDTIISAPATRWSFANVKERWFPAKKGSKSSKLAKAKSDKAKKTTALVKPGVLNLKNQKPKYQITDPSGVISSRANATLTISWNVQPWIGALLWDKSILAAKNGGLDKVDSWNLPYLKYQWPGLLLPQSGAFDFPPLKGAKKTEEVVKDRDGPKTPEPAKASGVV